MGFNSLFNFASQKALIFKIVKLKTTQEGSNQRGTDTKINSGFYFTVASKHRIRVTATTKSKSSQYNQTHGTFQSLP